MELVHPLLFSRSSFSVAVGVICSILTETPVNVCHLDSLKF